MFALSARLVAARVDAPGYWVLRDPDDDFLLALTSTAEAAAVVSGDGDLLEHPDLDPPAITAERVSSISRSLAGSMDISIAHVL